MGKLKYILDLRGKYSAGVERRDSVLKGLTSREAEAQVKDLMHQIGENVIGERAATAAYEAGLGASEWEAFLMPDERDLLTKFRKQVESL